MLHPTSLPETPGIGTIGRQAHRFVDWLVTAKQSLWQILPLGPTGYGDSPYASFSTFAGNPLLIDIDMLVEQNILTSEQAMPPDYIKSSGYIDYGSVVWWKIPLLKTAAMQFLSSAQTDAQTEDYKKFKEKNAFWLNDYAFFMSIKEFYDAKAQQEKKENPMWSNYWPKPLVLREPEALKAWEEEHSQNIEIQKAIQYFFFDQWYALKQYANQKGVSVIGDIPIFVASDSADVWANRNFFQLDENCCPKAVAGVPPDYFSETGQLWGNPLYDWDAMQKDGFSWWLKRIQVALEVVDYVRIDHFRGFEAYWSVPANEKTAINGKWVTCPGRELFEKIQKTLGNIPIIAEDLGVITDGVKALRDDFKLPGMRVLQFAFDIQEAGKGGFTNSFLPHMYSPDTIVYTGTHDNNTMQGWIDSARDEEISLVQDYVSGGLNERIVGKNHLCAALISVALFSCANFAVIPLQDIFCLGSDARMNIPSTRGGINWQWRMEPEYFDNDKALWLKKMAELSGRNMQETSKN
ncbi:MAG: 4-alpha-glucanotransferase [Spirochaetales bacterium]